jgi:hypothetical protein
MPLRQQRIPSCRQQIQAGLLALSLCTLPNATALVGSNSGSNIFNGAYINDLVGATTFYSMGFTGGNAIVANIEAGVGWNGHQTLGAVSTTIFDPAIAGTQLGQADWHATMVTQATVGNGIYTFQDGIAPGATLWAGAIATGWNPSPGGDFTGSFDITEASFSYAYDKALRTGINGVHADVLNSSWGFPDPAGTAAETILIDSLLRENRVVGVFAAGNEGPGANSVGGPASGFNGITVAALTGDTSNPAYSQVADFSSRGAADFYNPQTNTTTQQTRPVVDISAPGDNLTLAFYGGLTGGHTSGTDGTAGDGSYYIPNMSGTSFAAPIVAGAAALMTGAGKAFGGGEMIDPLVIKAALMTGATPTASWNNGQAILSGIIETTQALDLAEGAGALNLDESYRIYIGDPYSEGGIVFGGLNTQLGVSGLTGGTVLNRGWDLGEVGQNSPNLYELSGQIAAGSELTATLTWFAGRYGNLLSTAQDQELADLRMELLRFDPLGDIVVARSDAAVSTVEHFRLTVPETGIYMIRIVWDGFNFKLATSTASPTTTYGVAWNVQPVPEPSTVILILLAATGLAVHLRRTRSPFKKPASRSSPPRPCRS